MNYQSGNKEKRFLNALESLFTGAEVEGDSGFVNLMRMKRGYFKSIRPQLMERIDHRTAKDTAFREELFDKLWTFFSRYFCESGSIYFRHLPAFAKTYEQVYADGQDVALSWKTQMLYYVKSDVLVRSMPVELNEEGKPQHTRRFYFDASDFEHKKNNEKREFVFSFSEVKQEQAGKTVHLKVSYSQKGTKTKTDDILKASKKAGITLTEDELQKAIGVFCRQTEADFFINKDARGFLREQFDLWMYQYIFKEETIFEAERIAQLQAIKDTAYDIINFIAQFEDELRRVWEKPKFVRNVNYVVTPDKLTDKVLDKIRKHKGAKAQIKEWQKLNMVDEDSFEFPAISEPTTENSQLPLDTKHFKDLELEILDCLGNLDEALDGELVHSENWQALNTLQRRYRERVKCIYIDPPYNTGNDEFIYRDTYWHSSWLSMISNRLEQSKNMVKNGSLIFINCDNNELSQLKLVCDMTFGNKNFLENAIWRKRGEPPNNKNLGSIVDYVLIYGSEQNINLRERSKGTGNFANPDNDPRGEWRYEKLFISNKGGRNTPSMVYPIIDPVSGEKHYPPSNNRWAVSQNVAEEYIKDGRIAFSQKRPVRKKFRSELRAGITWSNLWTSDTHEKFPMNKTATAEVVALFGKEIFENPKPIGLVKRTCKISNSFNGCVLDYFAGSGTTAHAVINLNREDGGNRKYLLIEMGEYFHTVLLPRIKKVIYSKDWKDGKPVSREGSSHFLKYYTLEQYEETLKNARYEDGEQLELDSMKSPFEQYVFFGDDKLAHAVEFLKNGKLKINLKSLYKDLDIAESLSNVLGKAIHKRTVDNVSFEDGTTEKTNPAKMTTKEQQHFISLIKPYLWWGE